MMLLSYQESLQERKVKASTYWQRYLDTIPYLPLNNDLLSRASSMALKRGESMSSPPGAVILLGVKTPVY